MEIVIQKADYSELEPLRNQYLQSLPEFQELYLELLVSGGNYFIILKNNNAVGYVITTPDNILVEYYIVNEAAAESPAIFQKALSQLNIDKVWCKSFDFLLLDACLLKFNKHEVIGTLFRDYISSPNFFSGELTVNTAQESDLPFLLQQQDGLFETPEELEMFVKQGSILLLKRNNELVGCGFLIKIHESWNYYDVGMWVNPAFRNKGFAVQIISYLKNYCLANNIEPVCGCAFENIASQKTLEKNGFFSKHKLLEFS